MYGVCENMPVFIASFLSFLLDFYCTSSIQMFHSPSQPSSFNSVVDKQDSAVEMGMDMIRVKSIYICFSAVIKFDLLSSAPI